MAFVWHMILSKKFQTGPQQTHPLTPKRMPWSTPLIFTSPPKYRSHQMIKQSKGGWKALLKHLLGFVHCHKPSTRTIKIDWFIVLLLTHPLSQDNNYYKHGFTHGKAKLPSDCRILRSLKIASTSTRHSTTLLEQLPPSQVHGNLVDVAEISLGQH